MAVCFLGAGHVPVWEQLALDFAEHGRLQRTVCCRRRLRAAASEGGGVEPKRFHLERSQSRMGMRHALVIVDDHVNVKTVEHKGSGLLQQRSALRVSDFGVPAHVAMVFTAAAVLDRQRDAGVPLQTPCFDMAQQLLQRPASDLRI